VEKKYIRSIQLANKTKTEFETKTSVFSPKKQKHKPPLFLDVQLTLLNSCLFQTCRVIYKWRGTRRNVVPSACLKCLSLRCPPLTSLL